MQSSVSDNLTIALAGGLYGRNHDFLGRNNYSKKLDQVTITAANLATTVTINDVAFTVNALAATLTTAELAALLAAAVNAGSEPVTAVYVAAATTFTVQSDVSETTTTVVGTTNCSIIAQIQNAAAIPFGKFVCQDLVDDDKARLPVLTTDVSNALLALGITCHTQAVEQFYDSDGGAGYALNAEMSIVRRGSVWVTVEEAVTVQDSPFARFTVSGVTTLGSIRKSADSGKAVAIPTARFLRGAALGGLALLDINLS